MSWFLFDLRVLLVGACVGFACGMVVGVLLTVVAGVGLAVHGGLR